MEKRVGIVTVNWNRCQDTVECLESLQRQTYPNFRIFLVDNGSRDDSPAILRRHVPAVNFLESAENTGFAAGFNRGIRWALQEECSYILIINNDTVADPEMLGELVAAMKPGVGMTAPLIFFHRSPDRIWSAGGRCHPVTLEMTGRNPSQLYGEGTSEPLERDYLTGCALLISRNVLEDVGFFDERFFLYYEDMDYCLRVRRKGYRLLLVPSARLRHKVSVSSGGADSPEERYGMAKSSILFFRKHIRGWRWLVVIPWRLMAVLRITARLVLAPRGYLKMKAYWQGLIDGLTLP